MPFVIPTFNLAVSIWRTGWAANNYATPDVTTMGNLSPGKRTMVGRQGTTINTPPAVVFMELLLPKLTDIRQAITTNNTEDLVEVPAGSKRFYLVQYVDDIGKGFANEHRIAWIMFSGGVQTFADTGAIPVPVPIP